MGDKKGGAALMMIPGGKSEESAEDAEAPKAEGGDEDMLAANAFQAVQEDDEEGFKRSFKAAIRAAIDSYGEE